MYVMEGKEINNKFETKLYLKKGLFTGSSVWDGPGPERRALVSDKTFNHQYDKLHQMV